MLKHNKINDNQRENIIRNYNDGISQKEIANIFNLPKSTVNNIIMIYRREGRAEKKAKGGAKNNKMTETMTSYVRNSIEHKCDTTLKEITRGINSEFNVSISKSTIANTLKNVHITFKRLKVVAERSITEENMQQRRLYAQEFQDLLTEQPDSNIFFIDEVGMSISMRSKYGWAPVNESPVRTAPGVRSKNFSVCCCMNKYGNIFYKMQEVPYNGESFQRYIRELLVFVNNLNITNCTFILDNVSFHKSQEVKDIIIAAGHTFKYLPPYTPEFNPIENFFSKWKHFVRQSEPNNVHELEGLIARGVDTITSTDCEGYFRNMMRELRNTE